MKNNTLYVLWGGLFILCAALGFIPQPEGIVRFLLLCTAIVFFLPPAVLLFRAVKSHDRHAILLLRNLSALSLGLTLVLILLNIIAAPGSLWLGDFLHAVLVIVSVPMLCSGQWAGSLFLWACLLMVCIRHRNS